jgi:microcystin-dependent protein
MTEPYVGEIRCFGFTFAPRMYMFCNGQLLAIRQYTALFSILGTTYGGDGRTTFALPNLQGRIPMHWGPSNTGLNTVIGEEMGEPQISLIQTEMPAHNHSISPVPPQGAAGFSVTPSSEAYLSASRGTPIYATGANANAMFSPRAISLSGNSLPHENMQPYLTLNFCIAYEGIFPARN